MTIQQMQEPIDPGTLSPSVREVMKTLPGTEPIPVARLVNELLHIHGDYAGGLAGRLRLDESSRELAPVDAWLHLARRAYVEELGGLSTRLAILGLAVGHEEVGGGLVGTGLLPALAREIEAKEKVPVDRLFVPETRERWLALSASEPAGDAGVSAEVFLADAQETQHRTAVQTALWALADSPTATDRSLHFADYADAIAEFIESPKTGKPLTIGIDAAWGMGKTSLMYMIRERLDPAARVADGETPRRQQDQKFTRFRTIWFNAWKYDKVEALWAALVLEILGQTRSRSTFAERVRTWKELNWARFDFSLFLQDLLGSLVRPLFFLLLGTGLFLAGAHTLGHSVRDWFALAAAAGVAALYSVGKTAYEYFTTPFNLNVTRYIRTPNYEDKVGFLSEFEEDFRRVVRVVTKAGTWPLVVFVDDLDRCAPTKAVEVIEAINTVLDTEHCIFIIGMDGDAVAASVEAKYSELNNHLHAEPGALSLGERFLEKIVQISFRIPRAEKTVVDAFIGQILTGDGAATEAPAMKPGAREAEHAVRAAQRNGRREAADVAKDMKTVIPKEAIKEAELRLEQQATQEEEHVHTAVVEAAAYLDLNPRKIKRFINTFRLQALIARKRGMLKQESEVRLLARAVTVSTLWPDLVDGLLRDDRFIERLRGAHRTQGELARLQELPERQEGQERSLQAKLAACLADGRLQRLFGSTELKDLLDGLSERECEELQTYLLLTGPALAPA